MAAQAGAMSVPAPAAAPERRGLEYRLLTPEEFELLRPRFEEFGFEPPTPEGAVVSAALRDEELVGFLVLQLAYHLEPLWIAPEERGRVSWLRLAEPINELCARAPGMEYYTLAPSAQVARICEHGGMQELSALRVMRRGF